MFENFCLDAAQPIQPGETRLDDETAEFHDRVHQAYSALCDNEANRIRRVHAAIWGDIESHLAAHTLTKGPADV